MEKKWQAVAWSRELPKPMRNGRFYELAHRTAILLAGHAHRDGSGITVGATTIAKEAWCTVTEAMEVLRWLEDEKWFIQSRGPKGPEWACNPEITRGEIDEVEDRENQNRLRKAKNQRDKRDRDRLAKLASVAQVTVTDPGDALVTNPGDTEAGVTGVSHQRHRGPSPKSPGSVTATGDAFGYTRRSEPRKSLKTLKTQREDPKTRSAATASDAPLTLVDPIPSEQKPKTVKPEDILAKQYYDAMEGNVKYVAVRAIVKASLTKCSFDDVKRGLEQLAAEPTKPLLKQTLWNAIKGHQPASRFTAFQSSDIDYNDLGDFSAKHGA